ncbi:MAG TPA: nucleotidyltransferase family protein [Candidatus Limnocylindria bacterium]|nr:nucleotidyltransferase family protein [Candidatus Limnocylindria bacterium]
MPALTSADVNAVARPATGLALWCARQSVVAGAEAPPLQDMERDDWIDFLRLAQPHGILPIAWTALRPYTDSMDAAAAADLRQAYEANARHNLTMLGELHALTTALAAQGIRALSWKGAVLAQRAYGDIAARQFFDLDLLVPRNQIAAAQSVADSLGFRPEKRMADHEQEAYVDHQGELELVRPSDGLWVELHSAVVPTYYGRAQPSDEWWPRAVEVRFGRLRIAALDPIDELQALCIHGSKHRWDRLAWILDIAMLGRGLDDAQWSDAIAAATRHGTLRMLRLGLLLAADLCAAPIPAEVLGAARRDRAALKLARTVEAALFDPSPSRFDGLVFHAQMRERASDRLRYLASVTFTPSGADWESLRLPRVLFPLYAVTRPVRLAAKYGRRLVSPPRD